MRDDATINQVAPLGDGENALADAGSAANATYNQLASIRTGLSSSQGPGRPSTTMRESDCPWQRAR
jgi:hypothetical protein